MEDQTQPTADCLPEPENKIEEHFPFETQRSAQVQALAKISSSYERGKKFCMLELPTGVGKCFATGTLILMSDGSLKSVENIQVGDLIMGPDSLARMVLTLHSGEDEMFLISPVKGDSYTVNSQHLLSLRHSTSMKVAEISVQDYLSKSAWFKSCHKGYRVGVEFPEKRLPIDPYFLGLWLGDGNSDSPAISTADPEIVAYVYSIANKFGLKVREKENGSAAKLYFITTGQAGGSANKNPLLNVLRTLGVINNKHVPRDFKINSRENRLRLLAGYIDSDGESGHCLGFVSKDKVLFDDMLFVARSLGLAAYRGKSKFHKIYGTEYFRAGISGQLDSIPTLLARKTHTARKQKKNTLHTGITVYPTGRGYYHGFQIDGDGLFLLSDFTVVHNSPLAIATAKWASRLKETEFRPGAYILSTQNTLVGQYMRDFAGLGLVDLKGRSNYSCGQYKDTDCSIGQHLNKDTKCEMCPYREAKKEFCARRWGVTNFAYFLSETRYGGQLTPRKYLIIDECHNVEKEILSFADIEMTQGRADTCNAGMIPNFRLGTKQDWSIKFNEAVLDWMAKTFVPASTKYLADLDLEKEQYQYDNDYERAAKTIKKISAWEKFDAKIKQFILTDKLEDWIAFTDNKGNLVVRPLTATLFANDILFSRAEHVVLMSGTILDPRTFGRNLGIDRNDSTYLTVPSDFPVKNRPIYYKPQGSMSWNSKAETLPRMIRFIERILMRFQDVKGMIHTNSYETNNALCSYLYTTSQASRIITHGSGSGSREAAVINHTMSPDPTVLISPSMTEGLDLKDDLSRFQIICKIPYPYLDPYTKARMRRDEDWYQWMTALTLIQASGRSNRSIDDRAATFILDSAFEGFLQRNAKILPTWWTEAIQ